MAQEDLTLWTEIDPSGFVAVASNLVSVVNATHNLTTPVVFKDKGSGGYNGDFSIDLAIKLNSQANFPMPMNVSRLSYNDGTYDRPHTANDATTSANDDCIGFYQLGRAFVLNGVIGGARTTSISTILLALGQTYWLTFTLAGTTATLYVYSDINRTVLVDTISLAHNASIKRFISIAADYGGFGSGLWSADFSSVDIGDGVVSGVTGTNCCILDE